MGISEIREGNAEIPRAIVPTQEGRGFTKVKDLRAGLKSDLPLEETIDFDDDEFYGYCADKEKITKALRMISKLKLAAARKFRIRMEKKRQNGKQRI